MIYASTILMILVLALIIGGLFWYARRRRRAYAKPVEQVLAHPRRRKSDWADVDSELEPVTRYYKSPRDGGQRRESDDLLPTLGAIAVLSSLGDSSPVEGQSHAPDQPDSGGIGGGGFSTGGGFGGESSGGFDTGGMDSGGGSND